MRVSGESEVCVPVSKRNLYLVSKPNGFIWKWDIFFDLHWENDDKPVDLGVSYFQTKPNGVGGSLCAVSDPGSLQILASEDLRVRVGMIGAQKWSHWEMGVSMAMGVPNSWLVYFMENPIVRNGWWLGGIPMTQESTIGIIQGTGVALFKLCLWLGFYADRLRNYLISWLTSTWLLGKRMICYFIDGENLNIRRWLGI